MKTITLTDEAYERLKAWKEDGKDSFSAVVLRKVPKRGTFADLAEQLDKLPRPTEAQFKLMEEAVAWGNDRKNQRDPWAEETATQNTPVNEKHAVSG
jgi:predicted CopG family antitoxin